ncbi:MAG: alpha/beta fold hydrolase, partial [Rickettsiales bacterium]
RIRYFDAPNPQGEGGTHRITFYEWGNPYSPPVFCVHGLTRNGRDFDFLARRLAADYRVIAVDIAGRGKSEKLKRTHWYENANYMHDVLALAEWMNLPQFDWIGTSMGGIIGMMIAALMPGKITRLVLNDVGAVIPKEGLIRIGEYVGKKPDFATMDEANTYIRTIMEPFGIREETHWQHVMEHSFIRHENGRVSFAYDPAIGDAFRIAASQMEQLDDINLWMLWDAIDIPALIIRGEKSDILPHAVAVQMCEGKTRVSLEEFPGIGHAPTLMDDEQIAAVSHWLAENPA